MAQVLIELSEYITIFHVSGPTTFNDLLDVIRKHYPKLTRPHIIWNFSHADLEHKNVNMRFLPLKVKAFIGSRQGGRVAFVSSSPEVIALYRIYAIHAEVQRLPFSYNAFPTFEEALEWILQK